MAYPGIDQAPHDHEENKNNAANVTEPINIGEVTPASNPETVYWGSQRGFGPDVPPHGFEGVQRIDRNPTNRNLLRWVGGITVGVLLTGTAAGLIAKNKSESIENDFSPTTDDKGHVATAPLEDGPALGEQGQEQATEDIDTNPATANPIEFAKLDRQTILDATIPELDQMRDEMLAKFEKELNDRSWAHTLPEEAGPVGSREYKAQLDQNTQAAALFHLSQLATDPETANDAQNLLHTLYDTETEQGRSMYESMSSTLAGLKPGEVVLMPTTVMPKSADKGYVSDTFNYGVVANTPADGYPTYLAEVFPRDPNAMSVQTVQVVVSEVPTSDSTASFPIQRGWLTNNDYKRASDPETLEPTGS